MNERMNELDKAAQEYAGRIAGNDEDSNYVAWFNIYKEKFAELIVRECAEYVDTLLGDVDNPHYPDGEMIKEHFGVEE